MRNAIHVARFMTLTPAIMRDRRLVLLTALICTISVWITVTDGRTTTPIDEDIPSAVFRHYTLTYYRAPEHPTPPLDPLDPYDCFQKDNNGDLLVMPTTIEYFSQSARADMRAFRLKTKLGSSILIYQASPTRRWRYKTDCHGLTFLNGEYWLCNNEVQTILDDNGWVHVDERNVRRGDIAIYRNASSEIVHSARVIERDYKGHIQVASKNGYGRETQKVWAERVLVRQPFATTAP